MVFNSKFIPSRCYHPFCCSYFWTVFLHCVRTEKVPFKHLWSSRIKRLQSAILLAIAFYSAADTLVRYRCLTSDILTLLLSWKRKPTRILPRLPGKTTEETPLDSSRCPGEMKIVSWVHKSQGKSMWRFDFISAHSVYCDGPVLVLILLFCEAMLFWNLIIWRSSGVKSVATTLS